jgi:hypothetical protein
VYQYLTDFDNDGLPDYVETHGIMDYMGSIYYTGPENPDIDGDELTDDEEAGIWTIVNNFKYFKILSDPTEVDSDNDSLDDPAEYLLETDQFNPDTDVDGIIDGLYLEPLTFAPKTVDPSNFSLNLDTDDINSLMAWSP